MFFQPPRSRSQRAPSYYQRARGICSTPPARETHWCAREQRLSCTSLAWRRHLAKAEKGVATACSAIIETRSESHHCALVHVAGPKRERVTQKQLSMKRHLRVERLRLAPQPSVGVSSCRTTRLVLATREKHHAGPARLSKRKCPTRRKRPIRRDRGSRSGPETQATKKQPASPDKPRRDAG